MRVFGCGFTSTVAPIPLPLVPPDALTRIGSIFASFTAISLELDHRPTIRSAQPAWLKWAMTMSHSAMFMHFPDF